MARTQQSFIFDQHDLQRARAAAQIGGQSLNAWMRAAVRAALDGKAPTTTTSPAADPAIAQRLADLLSRIEQQHEQQQSDDAGVREERVALDAVLSKLNTAGNGFASLLTRYQAAAPAAPKA